jgi:type VI secretion system protein ImpH
MQETNPVQQQLKTEAYRFNFFQAVRLLELFAGGRPPGKGLSPSQDPVHFSVRPGFSFPASDIQGIKANGNSNGNGNGSTPQMTVNFMGLIGPKGVLPDWYNTHALARNHHKDYCFNDFLDLFHHRLISLFYLAWKKYRLTENYSGDCADPVSGVLASLAGATEREKAADPEFFEYAQKRLLHFCGLVARTVPTVAGIETIVAQVAGAPARIEQFVERLIHIHEQDRTRLGRKNSTLKKDALCGRSVRDASSFFIVEIGPLTWERYMAFAPRSRNLEMLRRLIGFLAGIEYEFDVRLIIHGHAIPALGLGAKIQAPILGRTAILRRPHRPHERNVSVKATRKPAAAPAPPPERKA